MSNIEKIKQEVDQPIKSSQRIRVGSIISNNYQIVEITRISKKKCYYKDKDGDEHSLTFDEIDNHYDVLNDITMEELEKQTWDYIINGEKEKEEPEQSTSTDLITTDKTMLTSLRETLENKKALIETKRKYVEMILDNRRRELQNVVTKMEKQIKIINKVLFTIELYFGISEEVVQIREGIVADINEPICFRQLMLYMDEEIAVHMTKEENAEGGFDFENIENFDRWVSKEENLKRILPEKKGMVTLRVRRRDKDYKGEGLKAAIRNGLKNENNKVTYLLIRNGDNLYRIYTELCFADKLFPLKSEIENLMKDEEYDDFFKRIEKLSEWNREKNENKIFHYKQQIILMQGLIDRSTLFHPLPSNSIKLMDPKTEELGYIKLIYDGESTLSDGRLRWKEYTKKNRETLKEGVRVITNIHEYKDEYYTERFERYYSNSYNCPSPPKNGMYTLYERDKVEGYEVKFKIFYNLKDEVRNWWDRWDDGHIRKNNVSFLIWEDEMLNVDEITIEDIDYYLENRIDRENYLSMINILKETREFKLREKEEEKDFISMMINYFEKENRTITEKDVQNAIDWWKLKNKWKRSLKKDDNLAFRMIYKKLKK